jgi:hypothetical protein
MEIGYVGFPASEGSSFEVFLLRWGEKEGVHRVDGDKGHKKQKNKKPKLIFNELLTKYKKETELNVNNRPRKVQSSKVPPKHKSQE